MQKEIKLEIGTDALSLWKTLTEARFTEQYMFNCRVSSGWTVGSPVIWRGKFEGYEVYQKGEVLEVQPNEFLKYSTFDPNYGYEDRAENYIHVSYFLKEVEGGTELTITNETFDGDGNRMDHIHQGWERILPRLKEVAEGAASELVRREPLQEG